MKEILRHIVWMTILVSWALLSASCRGGEVSYTDEIQPDDDTAILVLRTGLLDQTRVSDRVNDAVDNPVEYMYTLRIVILHENGTVEHNMYIDFGEIPQTECYRIFKVTRNETKKIYLIANEENASTDLHEQLETLTTGNTTFASIVDNFVFIPDYKNPIPMSSVYDVPVKAENLVEREFYLVRAATKFAFRFTNKRKSKVSIDAIHISDIAGATYLIPHKREPLFMSFDDESLYWINWLKKVADECIIDYRTFKAKEDCLYLEKLFKERQQEYYVAQKKYADYIDSHDNVILQSARTEQERLQNDMSLAYQVYSQVAGQLQVARAKVQEEKPVFAVVEPAVVPLDSSGTSRKVYVLAFIFLSVCAVILGKLWGEDILNKFKEIRA